MADLTWRERILTVVISIAVIVFYPLIWLAEKLSKEGPGWGD